VRDAMAGTNNAGKAQNCINNANMEFKARTMWTRSGHIILIGSK